MCGGGCPPACSSSEPPTHRQRHPSPPAPPQTSTYSSALFLTSGAQNLLVLNLAAKLGAGVPDAWMTWFIGCLPQAIVGMVIVPLLLFKQYPPEVRVCLCV